MREHDLISQQKKQMMCEAFIIGLPGNDVLLFRLAAMTDEDVHIFSLLVLKARSQHVLCSTSDPPILAADALIYWMMLPP